ncbi:Exosome complex component Rrp4 [Candidatus Methanobinarius endosymbioticus]|uniref:Exosome complex component Rrp4 n=1 Tax=Candidatus Methanobinarius endosymbioticus TaxID=2006182 RepID=A0A366M9R0_9EURY|nr:Exosome complex component Rrp4 [Candidatus Methanobinarius endosymbioticus]
MIHVEDKELVVPGQILAEEDYYSGRGTFKDGDSICSSLMGLVSLRNKKINVIPLKSKYVPKKGDVVIGEIDDVRFSMWGVDLNSPYSGILPASEVFGREKKELSKVFNVGDVLFLRVVDVDEVKKVKLGLKGRGMGKFKGGILVNITPTKVPRLIGKKGSMINMIKDKTKCKIVVGQNGLVWVKGEKGMEQITKNIINIIEAEAHTSGLTNRIGDKLFLLVDGKLPEKQEEEFEITPDDLESIEDDDGSNNENGNDSKINDNNESTDASTEEDELEKPKLENIKEEIESDLKFNSEKEDKNEKTSYLDTFNHLKAKNNNSHGLGEINKEDVSSPTLNIQNSSKSEDDNKIKPVTSWKKKN